MAFSGEAQRYTHPPASLIRWLRASHAPVSHALVQDQLSANRFHCSGQGSDMLTCKQHALAWRSCVLCEKWIVSSMRFTSMTCSLHQTDADLAATCSLQSIADTAHTLCFTCMAWCLTQHQQVGSVAPLGMYQSACIVDSAEICSHRASPSRSCHTLSPSLRRSTSTLAHTRHCLTMPWS